MRIFDFEIICKRKHYTVVSKEDSKFVEHLKNIIIAYNSKSLEKPPESVDELLRYYTDNFDEMYSETRNILGCSPFVVDNEIRAMLGHIFEYNFQDDQDDNLDKAYGHFRRLNIDTFKIICDKFDLFYVRWLERHYKYEFRSMDKDFLLGFAEKYYAAKTEYTKAQSKEHVGSDRRHHSILEDYRVAALKYVEMMQFYLIYEEEVKKIKIKTDVKKFVSYVIDAILLIAAIVPFFIK